MAVTQVYNAVPNDVITAARWNNEFGNIYDNGTDIAFPLTKAVSAAGFPFYLDQAQSVSFVPSASQAFIFTPGITRAGAPTVAGKAFAIGTSTFTDTSTAGSGTATQVAAVSIAQPTFAATNSSVTTTDAATLYVAAAPANGTNNTITNPWAIWVDAGKSRFDEQVRFDGGIFGNSVLNVGSVVPQKYIAGLTYSRDAGDVSNDILLAVGEACSDDTTPASRRLMSLSTAIIGQIDTGTWVVGTNQPKLDTGTVSDTDYFIWLIQRADTGVVDFLFSLSATAPTMPTNYAFKRLIGWFRRAAGANVPFVTYLQSGVLEFEWTTSRLDVDLAATLTTSRRTDVISVPIGFPVLAHVRIVASDASAVNVIFSAVSETDAAPATNAVPLLTFRVPAGLVGAHTMFIRTSSTGTVASRASLTVDVNYLVTLGFFWNR